MSFEGRWQNICGNGHYYERDVYYMEPREDDCPYCGDACAWSNLIDDTNGEEDGKIEPRLKTDAVWCTCPECGIQHVKEIAVFHIPKEVSRDAP